MTSHPLSDATSAPKEDELEISLFGKGVGESVIVHLGGGEWMVVDSFINRETGRPIALDYLDRIGLTPKNAVSRVVVSHWHDDHILGTSTLVDELPNAEVFLSAALRLDEIRNLIAASECPAVVPPTGIDEMAQVLRKLGARKRETHVSPSFALAEGRVYKGSHCEVFALSPSGGTFTRALEQLAPFLPAVGTRKRRISHEPNAFSIVLHVCFRGHGVLLGSDLEASSDTSTGWRAIVGLANNFKRSGVFKVAHHGSPNADCDGIWEALLEPSPRAILTPYLAGVCPRPSRQDVDRLRSRTPLVYCAGPSSPQKSRDLSAAALRMIRAGGATIRSCEASIGHVRVRIDGSGSQAVELFGSARQL